jgi:hypothetical protein
VIKKIKDGKKVGTQSCHHLLFQDKYLYQLARLLEEWRQERIRHLKRKSRLGKSAFKRDLKAKIGKRKK